MAISSDWTELECRLHLSLNAVSTVNCGRRIFVTLTQSRLRHLGAERKSA